VRLSSPWLLLPLAAVALLALLWLAQRHLIYFPLEHHVPSAAAVLPGGEELQIPTEDGLVLGAWYVPPHSAPTGTTVVVFNGNAGNRSFRAPLAQRLTAEGFAVVLFDYRGYGGNPGKPTETGLLRDARAIRAYLDTRPDIDATRLVYFGESLGAAVAIDLATEAPPAALILRSPFTSLTAIGQTHYPFLPISLLLTDRYPSIERIDSIRCPLLIVAGSRDRIVPHDQSRELFDAAPSEPKQFLLIDGADHNDMALLAGNEMIDAILRFLANQQLATRQPVP